MADMMDVDVSEEFASPSSSGAKGEENKGSAAKSQSKQKVSSGPPFTLKKWNAVAMWQWDVECDTCAICRVQVMGKLE